MPHYADGTEAKVGDQVFGKLYNTPGVRAGTIISITPGVESCNAMVGFLDAVAVGGGYAGSTPRMAVFEDEPGQTGTKRSRQRVVKSEAHGSAGDEYTLVECADYCATNELTKIPSV